MPEQAGGEAPEPRVSERVSPLGSVPGEIPGPGPGGGHAPLAEDTQPPAGVPAPHGTMTRGDIYAQPMKAGRPVPSGPVARRDGVATGQALERAAAARVGGRRAAGPISPMTRPEHDRGGLAQGWGRQDHGQLPARQPARLRAQPARGRARRQPRLRHAGLAGARQAAHARARSPTCWPTTARSIRRPSSTRTSRGCRPGCTCSGRRPMPR